MPHCLKFSSDSLVTALLLGFHRFSGTSFAYGKMEMRRVLFVLVAQQWLWSLLVWGMPSDLSPSERRLIAEVTQELADAGLQGNRLSPEDRVRRREIIFAAHLRHGMEYPSDLVPVSDSEEEYQSSVYSTDSRYTSQQGTTTGDRSSSVPTPTEPSPVSVASVPDVMADDLGQLSLEQASAPVRLNNVSLRRSPRQSQANEEETPRRQPANRTNRPPSPSDRASSHASYSRSERLAASTPEYPLPRDQVSPRSGRPLALMDRTSSTASTGNGTQNRALDNHRSRLATLQAVDSRGQRVGTTQQIFAVMDELIMPPVPTVPPPQRSSPTQESVSRGSSVIPRTRSTWAQHRQGQPSPSPSRQSEGDLGSPRVRPIDRSFEPESFEELLPWLVREAIVSAADLNLVRVLPERAERIDNFLGRQLIALESYRPRRSTDLAFRPYPLDDDIMALVDVFDQTSSAPWHHVPQGITSEWIEPR